MLYVVQIATDTEFGKKCCVNLITEDLEKAIRTAQEVENLGFSFKSNGTGAHVDRLETGRVYKDSDFDFTHAGNHNPPVMAVYSRIRWGDHPNEWVEKWFDIEAEKRFASSP